MEKMERKRMDGKGGGYARVTWLYVELYVASHCTVSPCIARALQASLGKNVVLLLRLCRTSPDGTLHLGHRLV